MRYKKLLKQSVMALFWGMLVLPAGLTLLGFIIIMLSFIMQGGIGLALLDWGTDIYMSIFYYYLPLSLATTILALITLRYRQRTKEKMLQASGGTSCGGA
jgi:uncharacterized BrkB/YihY/UPF0761 family membrane protein